ncbi:endonuclease domain-containing protein [Enemella sp. A6]
MPIDIAVRQAKWCATPEQLLAQVESLICMGKLGFEEAERMLGSRLAGLLDASGSGTETLVRLRLRGLNIKVRPQVRIKDVGWVDFVIGDRLVLEVDSREHHASRSGYHNDRRRDKRLVELGYLVLRITWEDVMFEWDSVVQSILALVRARKHLGRPKPC